MPTAQIVATIKTPQAGAVKSKVTVTETLASGQALTPTDYTLDGTTTPPWTANFTAGLGSTLNATQVDVDASGVSSPPATVPPFVVAAPALPAPTGDAVVGFSVAGVQ